MKQCLKLRENYACVDSIFLSIQNLTFRQVSLTLHTIFFGFSCGLFAALISLQNTNVSSLQEIFTANDLFFALLGLISFFLSTFVAFRISKNPFIFSLETVSNGLNSTNLIGSKRLTWLNNQILSVYIFCCSGCSNETAGCVGSLAAPNQAVLIEEDDFCLNDEIQSQCNVPEVCSAEVEEGCFGSVNYLPSFYPEEDRREEICTFFADAGLVGSYADEKCGGGIPQIFIQDLNAYFQDSWLLLTILASFVFAFGCFFWLVTFTMLFLPHLWEFLFFTLRDSSEEKKEVDSTPLYKSSL
eukprot:snap_masked-scaffold_15-processed-gene-7.34-mRNA-1 protein AED:1.00 eAED:1.00 QI:0/0/0/0/1/1/2/0/298